MSSSNATIWVHLNREIDEKNLLALLVWTTSRLGFSVEARCNSGSYPWPGTASLPESPDNPEWVEWIWTELQDVAPLGNEFLSLYLTVADPSSDHEPCGICPSIVRGKSIPTIMIGADASPDWTGYWDCKRDLVLRVLDLVETLHDFADVKQAKCLGFNKIWIDFRIGTWGNRPRLRFDTSGDDMVKRFHELVASAGLPIEFNDGNGAGWYRADARANWSSARVLHNPLDCDLLPTDNDNIEQTPEFLQAELKYRRIGWATTNGLSGIQEVLGTPGEVISVQHLVGETPVDASSDEANRLAIYTTIDRDWVVVFSEFPGLRVSVCLFEKIRS